MGYDSDDPMAAGEVGRVGVAIDSIEDMHLLFEGIPLEDVSTSMTINSTAAILLALYVALADERGVPRARRAISSAPPGVIGMSRRLAERVTMRASSTGG